LLCVIGAGVEIVGVLAEQADQSQNVVNRLLEQIGLALDPVLIAI
jgi:hypothetical protein